MSALPPYRIRAVHLTAVWAYAVGQPVFSLLQANPEFLVVRGATRAEVIAFASILTFVPPFVAFGCEWLLSRLSTRAADALHLVFLGVFLVPLVMLILKKLGGDSAWIVFAAALAALGIVIAYVRWRQVRLLFTLSVSLAAIGLVLFVARVPLVTEDVAGAQVEVPHKVPVVLVVLDELPITSLTTQSGEIDRARYPNFARLADQSTWYARATTVHEHTTAAVPSILTGKLPRAGELPTLAHHPENLFTLLGESHRLRATEPMTYLCPQRYCPRVQKPLVERLPGLFSDAQIGFLHQVLPTPLARGLPSVSDRWGGFSKERILVASEVQDVVEVVKVPGVFGSQPREFAEFLTNVDPAPQPTVDFLHVVLPHTPWQFFPSGRSYGDTPVTIGLAPGRPWSDRPFLVRQALQRHLLQVGYTDRLLGKLLRTLERTGLYDDALVIVVADHGISFQPGDTARTTTEQSIAEIAGVPLIIKFPQQKKGRVDLRAARTIDVLPTVADVLGVKLPWTVHGRSLLHRWAGPRSVAVRRRDGTVVRASASDVQRGLGVAQRRKEVFGPSWKSLLAVGLPKQFSGRDVGSTRMTAGLDAHVSFDFADLYEHVDTSSSFLPARITGRVEGIEVSPNQNLALAVNDRVVAATRCFRIDGVQRFSVLVPETAFRDGFNRLELLSVEGTRSAPRFVRIGQNQSAEHEPG